MWDPLIEEFVSCSDAGKSSEERTLTDSSSDTDESERACRDKWPGAPDFESN